MTNKTPAPEWHEGPLPPRSYRSIFKWGAPEAYKHPSRGLVALMRQTLGLPEAALQKPLSLGLEEIAAPPPGNLAGEQLDRLRAIVGIENVDTDGYTRLRASYGQAMIDALRLRQAIIENLPDVVVAPRSKEDVKEIIAFCNQEGLPLYPVSGRSSVTRGFEALRGGVALDLSTHMNKILALNESDQTVTVQPGIFGPALESALNDAPNRFGAGRRYTCGHFPQSFEYSTVGGWVSTRSAGQNSTYYGKIEDLVVAQEMVTPTGLLKTAGYPRQATGPNIDQLLIGSEGAFGVLVEVTLKIFRWQPENKRYFAYMFRTWEDACTAGREIMQGEAGYPSVFRISDAEETDVAMQLYGLKETPAEGLLAAFGYRPGEKCLMLGHTDGERRFSRNVASHIRRVCRSQGAFNLSSLGVAQRWEHSRFRDPYMRDDLNDFGVVIDTLECAATWENLPKVHAGVRGLVKQRPQTVCMTHISHAYPQGANLYFIFIGRFADTNEYLQLQYSILDALQTYGASMSHHHGLGKTIAPWLEGQVGSEHMRLLRTLKNHFDPLNIMNPGGTLGLDLSPEQHDKIWGMR